MNFDINVITANALVVVPIIVALVQAIKLLPWIKDYYSPLISIVLGIIVGFLSDHTTNDLSLTLLSGAVYGLMASGLYSTVKTTMLAQTRLKQQRQQEEREMKTQNNNQNNNKNKC
jgi:uncharacterized membrane protein